jgi:uncharacterized protein (TIGR03435 family)
MLIVPRSDPHLQPPDRRLEFEVASVKVSAPTSSRPTRMFGGLGSRDPSRFVVENFSFFNLLLASYEVGRYQLSTPAWMHTAKFDITAKIPEGTTQAQFHMMLRNLLEDRFKLALHREKKEMKVYELTVRGDRPKLKESTNPPDSPRRLDKDGLPILPVMTRNGQTRFDVINESMEQLATRLTNQINGQVTDATGLNGKYDIILTWSTRAMAMEDPATDSGPTLFTALEEQLGLKLVAKKGLVEVLVIDHAERTPTEN